MAVTTAAPAGAATSAKPQRCAEVVQVWAGGGPSFALHDAASLLPGSPTVRTVEVGGGTKALTAARFRQLERRGLEAPYLAGYQQRARTMATRLRTLSRTCPDALLVVGGYSDGAVAARQSLRSLSVKGDARTVRRVGAVLLFGDPLSREKEGEQVDLGGVRGVLVGDGPQLRLPRWSTRAGLALSWCASTDPVCRPSLGAADVAGHRAYDQDDLDHFLDQDPGTTLSRALDHLPTARTVIAPYAVASGSTRTRIRASDLFGAWSAPRITSADRLPEGLRVRKGRLTGTLPEGRHVAVLRVRSTRVAPALTRRVKVRIDVREQAAPAGTTLVTAGPDGRPADGPSSDVHVAADGRTVVFASRATNLVDTDVSSALREASSTVAYAWDAATGRAEVVGVGPGDDVLGDAVPLDVSADGRVVLLRAGGALYVRDRRAATTTLVPVPGSSPSSGVRLPASLAGDGSFVDVGIRTPAVWRWNRLDGTTQTFPVDTDFTASSPDGSVAALGGGFGREVYLRDLASGVSGPVVPQSANAGIFWAELSAGGRTLAASVDVIDLTRGSMVVDIARSTVLDRGMQFVPGVSADGAWYTGDSRRWQLQVTRTDGTASLDAFVRAPRGGDGRRSVPGAAALSGDGAVLAYTSAAVDLLPGVRPEGSQVYLWQVPR